MKTKKGDFTMPLIIYMDFYNIDVIRDSFTL